MTDTEKDQCDPGEMAMESNTYIITKLIQVAIMRMVRLWASLKQFEHTLKKISTMKEIKNETAQPGRRFSGGASAPLPLRENRILFGLRTLNTH
jgi:hypothetical protein